MGVMGAAESHGVGGRRRARANSMPSAPLPREGTRVRKPGRRHRGFHHRRRGGESESAASGGEAASEQGAASVGAATEPGSPAPQYTKRDRAEKQALWREQVATTLAPVASQEEFCARFGVGPAQYRASAALFDELARGKGFVTGAEWREDAPQTEAAQQWVRNIWRAFAPADDRMTLSEWLVFDGIRKHGSLEQRVVGSFVLYDHTGAGVLRREEVAAMMRTASEVAGADLSESLIQQALEILMTEADKDHVCHSTPFSENVFFFIECVLDRHRLGFWSSRTLSVLHESSQRLQRSSMLCELHSWRGFRSSLFRHLFLVLFTGCACCFLHAHLGCNTTVLFVTKSNDVGLCSWYVLSVVEWAEGKGLEFESEEG